MTSHSDNVDFDERLAVLEKLGDPLPRLDRLVDWEDFRSTLETVYRDKPRKSPAGRKPYDAVMMFKVLVLQHLYDLADEQTEYQIRDRHSFCRFLGLTSTKRVPDARTIWLFRERLKKRELVEPLFAELSERIESGGFRTRKGQIIDAGIVAVPGQRNVREQEAAAGWNRAPDRRKGRPTAFPRPEDPETR